MTIIAETPRLFLRFFAEKDIQTLAAALNNEKVVQWMTRIPFPYTLTAAQEWFDECQAAYAAGQAAFYVIADKTTDTLKGGIGLHPLNTCPFEENALELGYWLAEPFWGQGYMPEAAEALISFAFSTKPALQKILASTFLDNTASQGVLRKAGLSYQGNFSKKNDGLRGGDWGTLWSLTRADFEAKRRALS